jgi:hypothetical protein
MDGVMHSTTSQQPANRQPLSQQQQPVTSSQQNSNRNQQRTQRGEKVLVSTVLWRG